MAGGDTMWRVQSDGLLVRDPYDSNDLYLVLSPSNPSYNTVLANLRNVSATTRANIDQVLGGGAVAVSQSNQGVGKVMTSIASFFGLAGTKEEREAAQQKLLDAAAQYGPGIITGVQNIVGNSGSSLSSLQRQLARKKAKYYTTTNATKKLELKYEIEALEEQIANYHLTIAGIQTPSNGNGNGNGKPFPVWIPLVILGGVGLVVGAVVLSRKGG
jgi:hypothetical protein